MGWHPFLRINRPGHSRPQASATFRPLTQAVSRLGPQGAGPGGCFTTPARQLTCTLRARWDAGYREPWLVLTDLPATATDVAWYGRRAWSECGFKDSQRGGGHGEQPTMTNPARAERLWLALALATFWTVSVGCQAEVLQPRPDVPRFPEPHIARRRASRQAPVRARRCFRCGRWVIVAALCTDPGLPLGQVVSEPWPQSCTAQDEQSIGQPHLPKAA